MSSMSLTRASADRELNGNIRRAQKAARALGELGKDRREGETTHDKINNSLLNVRVPDPSVGALLGVEPRVGVLVSRNSVQLRVGHRLVVDGDVGFAWVSAFPLTIS